MKYHYSEFTSFDNELLYQHIEEIKPYVSESALFLIEDLSDKKELRRIVLKVKDGEALYVVESSAPTLYLASQAAKDEVIRLILKNKVPKPTAKIEDKPIIVSDAKIVH